MPETLTPFANSERIIASRIERGPVTAPEIDPLRDAMRARAAKILATKQNASLSDAAREFTIEQEIQRGERDIDDFKLGSERVRKRFEANEDRAIATPKVDDKRAAAIWAWASGKSAAERAAVYFRAVDEHDHETVAAFETAPRAFGLLDDVSPERARLRKLAALPAETRAELEAARARIAAYEHIADAVLRDLHELAR